MVEYGMMIEYYYYPTRTGAISAYVEWKDSENCKDYCIHCFDRDVGGWDPGWGGPEIQYGCDVDGARVELEDVCRFEPSRFEVAKDENIL